MKVAVEVVALPYYQHGKGKHKAMKPISLMVSHCGSYCSSVIRGLILLGSMGRSRRLHVLNTNEI